MSSRWKPVSSDLVNQFDGGFGGLRNLPHSIGVKVSDRITDSTTAALRVKANSRISRPTTPPMNIRGVNTAISEMEIDMMVKLISAEPSRAAWNGFWPSSIRRQITSTMTMASSTTKPTAMVMAIRDRLSRLKPSGSMTAVVASKASGITTLGMTVALTLRRNRKITATTSTMVIREGDLHVLDRGPDGLGAVRQDVDLDGGRDVRLQLGQRRLDPVDRLDDVGAGLLDDEEQDGRTGDQRLVRTRGAWIDPRAELVVLDVLDGAAEVPDADRRAVIVATTRLFQILASMTWSLA